MAQKISSFDDWTDYFSKWQKDIGFDASQVKDYKFDAFYADPPYAEIEFGEFKGRKKWEKLLDVPTPEDARCIDASNRLSGRHRVRLDRATARSPAKCAKRVRSPMLVARHARRTAPWLADVPCPGEELRRLR